MDCVLHIGLEKTGTKTLQAFLNANRERLADHSLLFPASPGRRNHRLLALLAYADEVRDDITAKAKVDSAVGLAKVRTQLLADLQHEVQSRVCRTLLLSSEHFQSRLRDGKAIERFRQALMQLGCQRFRVIVYLRDPVEIARSLHASSVASGSTAAGPPAPDNPYFRNICDHRATLQRWSGVFGHAAVMPRLFDRAELVGGSIIDDFCDVMGFRTDKAWARPTDQNQSISAHGLDLLRRLNKVFPRVENNRINPRRGDLANFVRDNYPGAPYILSAEVADAYRQYFAQSNEWVRQNYFPERSALFAHQAVVDSRPDRISEADLNAEAGRIAKQWMQRKP